MIQNPNVTPVYLTWLNYLGGFEYFIFLAEKQFELEIFESGTTRENIFPNWPQSYGETASTIDKKRYTTAKNKNLIRSQHLTENQRDALKYIKTSPVVQIVTSRRDRRTVIVDNSSYTIYDEGDKQYTIQFYISFTDEIQAQRL